MKKILILLILSILVFSLYATEAEDLALRAWENSYDKTQLEVSKEKTALKKALDEINGTSVSVNFSDSFFSKDSLGNFSWFTPYVFAEITYPEIAEDLSFSNSFELEKIRLDTNNNYRIAFGTAVKKVIQFNDTDKDIKEQMESLSEKNTDVYEKNSFIMDVFSSIKKILNLEHKIVKSEKSLERSRSSYETDLRMGTLVSGSVLDLNRQAELNNTLAEIEEQKKNLEVMKNTFRINYGVEYEDITEVRSADLTIKKPESDDDITAYSVQYKKLKLKQVEQSIREKTNLKSSLSLEGEVMPVLNFSGTGNGKGYDSTDLKLSARASYTSSDWTLTMEVSEPVINWDFSVPVVSIYGRYDGGSKKNKTSEIELKQLDYDLNAAEKDYSDTVRNYKSALRSYENEIYSLNNRASYLNEISEMHSRILAYSKKLRENNMISETDYEDAVDDMEDDDFNLLIYRLEALELEYKIKQLEYRTEMYITE